MALVFAPTIILDVSWGCHMGLRVLVRLLVGYGFVVVPFITWPCTERLFVSEILFPL